MRLREVLAARNQALEEEDRKNPSRQGQRTDLLYNKKSDIQEVGAAPTGTSAEAFLRRLRKDRPDIHARVLAGELTPETRHLDESQSGKLATNPS